MGSILAPTCWYFAAAPPEGAISPRTDTWTCLFSLMDKIQEGRPVSFTAKTPGCVGAGKYLGFNDVPPIAAALFLSGKERLKKDAGLAAAFYDEVRARSAKASCLVISRLDSTPCDIEVEVINLWIDAASLSALHTLANYDRASNDNVIMPFSSGCQSIWTLPYKEAESRLPSAVAGSLDPTVRGFLPEGTISFSAPATRFVEMCSNIEGSFLAP
ncbi:MAG: DUF169 domain-containing protein [Thermoleophilia bacterium]